VHGEGDLMPSFVVDRYGDYVVIQSLSQGTDRLQGQFAEILNELLQPAGILARNDPRVRLLEGLEQRVEVLHGEIPDTVVVREGQVEYDVDLRHGQKTGAFLDQRENRAAAAQYVHGRVLDCFSYAGGFALQLASRASELTALDISEDATTMLARNAARNGLSNVSVRTTNVFDELRALERVGERYDAIVLDPPAFAKTKDAIPKAQAGYKEINLRALKLLPPGGFLITCSCSYHVSESAFAEIILDAAIDARSEVTVVEKRMQSRDHPVVLGMPETYYLKCFILRKLS
jgi:23S rRNA (cytosine1962-C5)-methyltransferase